ncbi:hypothetical protein GF314_12915 [bacterium]|nr:hypothetical protein [bacterium]
MAIRRTARWGLRAACVLLMVLVSPVGADELTEIVVVAHPDVPVDTISPQELRRIYLGKSTRWSGGLAIRPVMLAIDRPYRRFIVRALEHTEDGFEVYWKRMVFTGKGRPPRTFATPDELAFYVRMTPGAIGYLPREADRTDLKVVHVR